MPPLLLLLFSLLPILSQSTTDPGDYAILLAFQSSLDNPEILKWPSDNQDPCGPPKWPHVYCEGSRVSQIQIQNLGVSGTLPANFTKLSMLSNLGFQSNKFRGKLPSFRGLSNLKYAFLNGNQFDTIPSDFFGGLTSLLDLSLDGIVNFPSPIFFFFFRVISVSFVHYLLCCFSNFSTTLSSGCFNLVAWYLYMVHKAIQIR